MVPPCKKKCFKWPKKTILFIPYFVTPPSKNNCCPLKKTTKKVSEKSLWHLWYYPHRLGDLVSPLCGIFFGQKSVLHNLSVESFCMWPSVAHLPHAVAHLWHAVKKLQPPVAHLQPAVTHLWPGETHLQSAVANLWPSVAHLRPGDAHLQPCNSIWPLNILPPRHFTIQVFSKLKLNV